MNVNFNALDIKGVPNDKAYTVAISLPWMHVTFVPKHLKCAIACLEVTADAVY